MQPEPETAELPSQPQTVAQTLLGKESLGLSLTRARLTLPATACHLEASRGREVGPWSRQDRSEWGDLDLLAKRGQSRPRTMVTGTGGAPRWQQTRLQPHGSRRPVDLGTLRSGPSNDFGGAE